MMTFALAAAIGASFWSAHGQTIPCHPQPVKVTDQQMTNWGIPGAYTAAYPHTGNCDIFISPGAAMERYGQPDRYCAAVVHEEANIMGIPETHDGGLMDPNAEEYGDAAIPWDCRHWRTWQHRNW